MLPRAKVETDHAQLLEFDSCIRIAMEMSIPSVFEGQRLKSDKVDKNRQRDLAERELVTM